MNSDCVFCRIVSGDIPTDIISEDADTLTFLDQSPVFPGHLLIVPRRHVATLPELPEDQLAPFFSQVRRAASVVGPALDAHGSFVGINNKVSQTVPHLHAHVIPRRVKDGLRGFFWPRRGYKDEAHRQEIVARLREAYRSV